MFMKGKHNGHNEIPYKNGEGDIIASFVEERDREYAIDALSEAFDDYEFTEYNEE